MPFGPSGVRVWRRTWELLERIGRLVRKELGGILDGGLTLTI